MARTTNRRKKNPTEPIIVNRTVADNGDGVDNWVFVQNADGTGELYPADDGNNPMMEGGPVCRISYERNKDRYNGGGDYQLRNKMDNGFIPKFRTPLDAWNELTATFKGAIHIAVKLQTSMTAGRFYLMSLHMTGGGTYAWRHYGEYVNSNAEERVTFGGKADDGITWNVITRPNYSILCLDGFSYKRKGDNGGSLYVRAH